MTRLSIKSLFTFIRAFSNAKLFGSDGSEQEDRNANCQPLLPTLFLGEVKAKVILVIEVLWNSFASHTFFGLTCCTIAFGTWNTINFHLAQSSLCGPQESSLYLHLSSRHTARGRNCVMERKRGWQQCSIMRKKWANARKVVRQPSDGGEKKNDRNFFFLQSSSLTVCAPTSPGNSLRTLFLNPRSSLSLRQEQRHYLCGPAQNEYVQPLAQK